MRSTQKNKLPPLYFLSGDETLLLEEARTQLVHQSKAAGFSEHRIINISTNSDWDLLTEHLQSLDLFSSKQIIDVRNPSAKFDTAAQKILTTYLENPNPDNTVIISTGKLTAAQKKAKWFQPIDTKAHVLFIWPIKKQDLTRWALDRFKQHHLTATPDVTHLLIELTEGNLLATQQAIQKLSLLYPKQTITAAQLASAVHDSSEFNVFDLSNYMLAGKIDRVIHIMSVIQEKDSDSTLVLWALTRDLRLLYTLKYKDDHHESTAALLSKEWDPRKTLLQKAIRHVSATHLIELLKCAHQADLAIKGLEAGNPWEYLRTIAVNLAKSFAS